MSRQRLASELAQRYTALHGGAPAPSTLYTMEAPDPRGGLVELGGLHFVEYLTRRDDGPKPGQVVLYRHRFTPGGEPVLAVNPAGKLIILGGVYRVGRRGIEG
jgi:hypothetical protein